MDCPTLALKTLLTPEIVRGWAEPFANTGIEDLHLYHIVAGQAAAYAALNVISGFSVNPEYRPSVDLVREWVSQSTSTDRENLLYFVAARATNWVVSQVCPV